MNQERIIAASSQESILETNKVLRNTYMLLAMTLLFSAATLVVLGVVMTLPVIVFGLIHLRNARNRRNRLAIRVGYSLFAVTLLLLASGFVDVVVDPVMNLWDLS